MTAPEESSKIVHQGRNVRRFREMLNLKQEALANILGDKWNQKRVSLMESKEKLDEEALEQFAKALNVPADAIKNFTEEKAINIIAATVNAHDHSSPSLISYQPTYNPIDKLLESMEEIKRLNTALLKEKDDRIQWLEKLLDKK